MTHDAGLWNPERAWVDELEVYANTGNQHDREVSDYVSRVGEPGIAHAVRRLQFSQEPIIYSASLQSRDLLPLLLRFSLARETETKSAIDKGSEYKIVSVSAAHHRNATPESPVSALSRTHRRMWLFLALFSSLWGIIAGITFASGYGVGLQLALFGVLGNAVLGLSLYRLGAASTLADR